MPSMELRNLSKTEVLGNTAAEFAALYLVNLIIEVLCISDLLKAFNVHSSFCRGCLDLSKSQDRASNGPAQEAIRVQEHHVLIFFGTLPRLQIAFGNSGTAFVDAVGDTVAHM